MQTIYKSDLVVNVGSTALSYALIFKKPILLIYNESIKNGISFNTIKNLSNELDCNITNIENDDYKQLNLNKIHKFSEDKYINYINNYVSYKSIKKTNAEIISSLVNNDKY